MGAFISHTPREKSEWEKEQDEMIAARDRLEQEIKNPNLSHEERQQKQWTLDDLNKNIIKKKKANAFTAGKDKLDDKMRNQDLLRAMNARGRTE